jgi:hypothetical protein
MHVQFKKPEFDEMGSPIKPKDQRWHAFLYDHRHIAIAYGIGKTKEAARENLQRDINSMLEEKLRKYTHMLNFVTKHEVR